MAMMINGMTEVTGRATMIQFVAARSIDDDDDLATVRTVRPKNITITITLIDSFHDTTSKLYKRYPQYND